jgi:tetrahydromethanopterin S-methyltransferase subunit B
VNLLFANSELGGYVRRRMAEQGDPRLALIFDEMRRSLDQQQRVLDELRSRTGTLVSSAGVATAFLGGVVLGEPHRPLGTAIATAVAILAFVALTSLCLAVLLPKEGWIFRSRTDILLQDYANANTSMDDMLRELSTYMEGHFQKNGIAIGKLQDRFSWASVGLGIEIVSWLAALVLRGGGST